MPLLVSRATSKFTGVSVVHVLRVCDAPSRIRTCGAARTGKNWPRVGMAVRASHGSTNEGGGHLVRRILRTANLGMRVRRGAPDCCGSPARRTVAVRRWALLQPPGEVPTTPSTPRRPRWRVPEAPRAAAHLRPSGLFLMKFCSHSDVTDLGRSRGSPSARSQKSCASTPYARPTPKSTV